MQPTETSWYQKQSQQKRRENNPDTQPPPQQQKPLPIKKDYSHVNGVASPTKYPVRYHIGRSPAPLTLPDSSADAAALRLGGGSMVDYLSSDDGSCDDLNSSTGSNLRLIETSTSNMCGGREGGGSGRNSKSTSAGRGFTGKRHKRGGGHKMKLPKISVTTADTYELRT